MRLLCNYVPNGTKYLQKIYNLNHDRIRCIVSWSKEPPLVNSSVSDYYERVGSIVLLESSCYNSHSEKFSLSWSKLFEDKFPRNGIHTEYIDLFSFPHKQNGTTIPDILEEMKNDLMFQNSTCVLVARGAMPCLLAQYYLESFPLAGLVMIDPCIIPHDKTSLQTTASEYLSSLSSQKLSEKEIVTLNSLKYASYTRTMRLEQGTVPMLIMYSTFANKDSQLPSAKQDYFLTAKEGAYITASYHAGNSDEVNSCESTAVLLEQMPMSNAQTMERIFSFFDDVF